MYPSGLSLKRLEISQAISAWEDVPGRSVASYCNADAPSRHERGGGSILALESPFRASGLPREELDLISLADNPIVGLPALKGPVIPSTCLFPLNGARSAAAEMSLPLPGTLISGWPFLGVPTGDSTLYRMRRLDRPGFNSPSAMCAGTASKRNIKERLLRLDSTLTVAQRVPLRGAHTGPRKAHAFNPSHRR